MVLFKLNNQLKLNLYQTVLVLDGMFQNSSILFTKKHSTQYVVRKCSLFSSLKFHNTLFPFFYTYSTLFCHMIVPIYMFTSLGYAEISSLRALSLRVYQWSISFLRSGWIACISGFPTLLAKCWGHSSYPVSLSNCTPKQSSNLTKTSSSRAKSLDTNHIFFQLYQS